jgi:hypothetical protein
MFCEQDKTRSPTSLLQLICYVLRAAKIKKKNFNVTPPCLMLTIINHYTFWTFRKRNQYVLTFKSDHCYTGMNCPRVSLEARGTSRGSSV